MAYARHLLNVLLNNNVTLVILYSLLRYFYSDLIPLTEWMPSPISTADRKSGMAFPSIQEVEGKWVVACGVQSNGLPAPSWRNLSLV